MRSRSLTPPVSAVAVVRTTPQPSRTSDRGAIQQLERILHGIRDIDAIVYDEAAKEFLVIGEPIDHQSDLSAEDWVVAFRAAYVGDELACSAEFMSARKKDK